MVISQAFGRKVGVEFVKKKLYRAQHHLWRSGVVITLIRIPKLCSIRNTFLKGRARETALGREAAGDASTRRRRRRLTGAFPGASPQLVPSEAGFINPLLQMRRRMLKELKENAQAHWTSQSRGPGRCRSQPRASPGEHPTFYVRSALNLSGTVWKAEINPRARGSALRAEITLPQILAHTSCASPLPPGLEL